MITKKFISMTCLSILLLATLSFAQVDLKKERGGYSATFIEKFDVSPGGKLVMKELIGDVTIIGGSSGQVELIQNFFLDVDTEKEAESAFQKYRADVTKQGNTVRVVGPERSRRRYVDISYEVSVPQEFNVDVETMGGEMTLKNLIGEAILETLGGDIEVKDVVGDQEFSTAGGEITANNVEGSILMETSGGDLELKDAKKGPFKLKTAGGEIVLLGVQGNVDASTSGGDIEARNVTGDLDLSTSGGDISLQEVVGKSHSAGTSGGDVEARTVTGDVELKTSGGNVETFGIQGNFYGRTSGGDIEVNRVSGDAEVSTAGGSLELESVGGRLQGKTSGGDIRARVDKGMKLKSPIKLSTSGGEIILKLPSDVKATIEAVIRIDDPFADYTVRSDFKLKIVEEEAKGRRGRRTIYATGDINGGGPLIDLSTAEGDIIIEKTN